MSHLSHFPLEPQLSRFEKFLLYETSTFYYLVGFDSLETAFQIIKIDRRVVKPSKLEDILKYDPVTYSKDEFADMLHLIHEGHEGSGGIVKIASGFGVLGFMKFLDCYYLILITQRKKVGCIGGNLIYATKATEIFPIKPRDDNSSNIFQKLWTKLNKKLNQTSWDVAESRYMGLFQFVDITKDFFFSYTYDLTHSLQHNFIVSKCKTAAPPPPQDMFVWNHYQTEELRNFIGPRSSLLWSLPVIHGSFQQRRFSIFGRPLSLILIARRSRHYAGTRYLKRGVSVHGRVANDVEVEQIFQLDEGRDAKLVSCLQMRGSIPTYWFQETSVTMPKPPICVNKVDPHYLATQEHFADLFFRYNMPIIVLDLVKQAERRPREVIVGREYRLAVEVVNSSIPLCRQIRYLALDYTKINKSKSKGGVGGTDDVAANEGGNQGDHNHLGGGGAAAGGVRGTGMMVAGSEWATLEKTLGESLEQNQEPVAKPKKSKFAFLFGSGNKTTRVVSTVKPSASSIPHPDHKALGGGQSQSIDHNPEGDLPRHGKKVDLFEELDDIASMTISETAFFCSDTTHLDRVPLLQARHIKHARNRGYLEQRGVLRTNCIDCLDRTNGGQFALGMKLLTIFLQALGLSEKEFLDPSSQLLKGLMEMFGELGDRIAVQYGGSEAHKKMSAGSGHKSSSSKHGELLTSIKRYYSNAFTDMVKQDAMNIFLGCYSPIEQQTPLWDLETDYHLHNRLLQPPQPFISKIIFNDMLKEIKIHLGEMDRRELERDIQDPELWNEASFEADPDPYGEEFVVFSSPDSTLPSPSTKPSSAPTADSSISGSGWFDKDCVLSLASQHYQKDGFVATPRAACQNRVLKKVDQRLSELSFRFDFQHAFSRYYLQHPLINSHAHSFFSSLSPTLDQTTHIVESLESMPLSQLVSSIHSLYSQDSSPTETNSLLNTNSGLYTPTNSLADDSLTPTSLVSSASSEANRFLTQIVRSERRRHVQSIMRRQLNTAVEQWWRAAVDSHLLSYFHHRVNLLTAEFQLALPYFDRVHATYELTFFDELITLEYMDTREITALQPRTPRASSPSSHLIELDEDLEEVTTGATSTPARQVINVDLYVPEPPKPVSPTPSDLNSSSRIFDGMVNIDVAYDLNKLHYSPPLNADFVDDSLHLHSPFEFYSSFRDQPDSRRKTSGSLHCHSIRASMSFEGFDPLALAMASTEDFFEESSEDQQSRLNSEDELDQTRSRTPTESSNQQGGFQFTRYFNEIGIKARRLVGGFLKKEEESAYNESKDNHSDHRLNNPLGWSSSDSSSKTSALYQSYSDLSQNPMLFLEDTFHKHKSSSSAKEFKNALKDVNIEVDDVGGMEALSNDSYVSRFISRGEYEGLPQGTSAQNTSNITFASLVFVEKELQQLMVENKKGDPWLENASNKSQLTSLTALPPFPTASISVVTPPIVSATLTSPSPPYSSVLSQPSLIPGTVPLDSILSEVDSLAYLRLQNQSGSDSAHCTLSVPENTRDRLTHYTDKLRVSSGVEAVIQRSAHQYLFGQMVYSREVSEARLAKRLSTLTNEKSVSDYLSLSSKDNFLCDVDTLSFMLQDRPSSSSSLSTSSLLNASRLGSLSSSLRPLQAIHNQHKREVLSSQSVPSSEGSTTLPSRPASPIPTLPSSHSPSHTTLGTEPLPFPSHPSPTHPIPLYPYIPDSLTHSLEVELHTPPLERSPSLQDYQGFSRVSSDFYVRKSNPFLLTNEVTILSFKSVAGGVKGLGGGSVRGEGKGHKGEKGKRGSVFRKEQKEGGGHEKDSEDGTDNEEIELRIARLSGKNIVRGPKKPHRPSPPSTSAALSLESRSHSPFSSAPRASLMTRPSLFFSSSTLPPSLLSFDLPEKKKVVAKDQEEEEEEGTKKKTNSLKKNEEEEEEEEEDEEDITREWRGRDDEEEVEGEVSEKRRTERFFGGGRERGEGEDDSDSEEEGGEGEGDRIGVENTL